MGFLESPYDLFRTPDFSFGPSTAFRDRLRTPSRTWLLFWSSRIPGRVQVLPLLGGAPPWIAATSPSTLASPLSKTTDLVLFPSFFPFVFSLSDPATVVAPGFQRRRVRGPGLTLDYIYPFALDLLSLVFVFPFDDDLVRLTRCGRFCLQEPRLGPPSGRAPGFCAVSSLGSRFLRWLR